MSPWHLRQISHQITRGAVFAYPTDTIWGLGCHPLRDQAVQRIYQIKQRRPQKSLILLSSRLEYFRPYIDPQIFNRHYKRLSEPQPRPVTWITPASSDCPRWIRGQGASIAIRVTHRPLIKTICESLNSPIVSTSANISGHPTCRNSLQIHKYFHQLVDYIIEGFDQRGQPGDKNQASQIRSIQSNKIFRA